MFDPILDIASAGGKLTQYLVALPIDIHAPNATYATQFGLVERPTHRNTTHDQAKFECCAHGFVDLSENGYGVAIASRDKYGYSVEGNTMRCVPFLSLLQLRCIPDPPNPTLSCLTRG